MALQDALDYLSSKSGSSTNANKKPTPAASASKNLGSALDYLNSADKTTPKTATNPVDDLVSLTVNDTNKTVEQSFQPKIDELSSLKQQIEATSTELENFTVTNENDAAVYNQKVNQFNADIDKYNVDLNTLQQAYPQAIEQRAKEVQFEAPEGVWKKYSWGVNETMAGVWRGIGNLINATGSGLGYLGAYGTDKAKQRVSALGKDPSKENGGLWQYYTKVGELLAFAGDATTKEFQTEYSVDFDEAFQLDPIGATKKNPMGFYLKATEQVPLTLALMIPGIGASGAIAGTTRVAAMSPFARMAISSIGGATIMRPIEGLMEAGQAYEEGKKKGLNESDAVKAGADVFLGNQALVATDAVQLLAVTPALKMLAGADSLWAKIAVEAVETIISGGLEGGEEVYQNYLQKRALGEDFELFDNENVGAFMLGAVSGMVFQAAGSAVGTGTYDKALEEYTDEVIDRLPDPIKEETKRAVKEAVAKAQTPEEKTTARVEALDQVTQQNPDEVQTAVDAINEEAKAAFEESRVAVEEEALAEYNAGTEPDVDVESVFNEVTTEPTPVDELKAGQDAILAALEGATQEETKPAEDLKAPTDKQVKETKPVEVEKAKKEDTEPLPKTMVDEVTGYYDGKEIAGVFRNKKNDVQALRLMFNGQWENAKAVVGLRLGKQSTDAEFSEYNALDSQKEEVFNKVLDMYGRKVDKMVADTVDNVTNQAQNKENETAKDTNDSGDGVGSRANTVYRGDDSSGQGTRRKNDTSDSKSVLGGKRSGSDTGTRERSKQAVTKQGWDGFTYFNNVGEQIVEIVKEKDGTYRIYTIVNGARASRFSNREYQTVSEAQKAYVKATANTTEMSDADVVVGNPYREKANGKEWVLDEKRENSVTLYPRDKQVYPIGRVVPLSIFKTNFEPGTKQLQYADKPVSLTETKNVVEARSQEEQLVEKLQAGESVKATDLMSAMGIEVVQVKPPEAYTNESVTTFYRGTGGDRRGLKTLEDDGTVVNVLGDTALYLSKDKEVATKYGEVEEIEINLNEENVLSLDNSSGYDGDVTLMKFLQKNDLMSPLDPVIAVEGAGRMKEETEKIAQALRDAGYTAVDVIVGNNDGSLLARLFEDNQTVFLNKKLTQTQTFTQEVAKETAETMEEIVARSTTIENGEVKIVEDLTEAELEALEEFEPAGGNERKGAEGRGLLDEYYTPEEIVEVLDQISRKYQPTAFKNGTNKVLEPAAGIGNLFAGAPLQSIFEAHEINETAARILKLKHPSAEVYTTPLEDKFIDRRGNPRPFGEEYSTVIMNPPYGEHRGKYKGLGEEPNIRRYEDYFMKRGMDVLVPDGMMYAIVPSLFLRNSALNNAKKELAKSGELVEAIRFPNGAFETTDIGTDLLVFRKNSEGQPINQTIIKERLATMSDNKYFVDNPTHILGTEGTRRGRFGEETFVEGTLEEALTLFENLDLKFKPSYTDIKIEEKYKKEEEQKLAAKKKADKPVEKKIQQKEKTKTKKVTRTKKFDDPSKKKKAPPVPKVAVYESDKVTPEKDLLDLSTFSNATEADKKLWDKVTAAGDLDIEVDTNKAIPLEINYMGGKWYNDFNYLQGNIADKLEQLEQDYRAHANDNLPEVNYRSQKAKLEKILPELHPVERMLITPNSDFVRDLAVQKENGDETTLSELFYDWLRTLPYEAFGNSSLWAIRGYINNNAVRGNDKIKNETERRTRRDEGNRLFKLFITENLSDRNKKTLLNAYNSKFNSYVRPNYKLVPLTAKIHPTFISGKPLILKDVQKEGIAFLLNKGTGILAHDVGVGKTLEAIITNAELLQRGWAKKPLIVVPSISVYNQWFKEIREVIPNIKINLLGNLGSDFYGDINNLNIEEGTLTLMTAEGFKKLGFTDKTYQELTGDLVDAVDKKKAGITTTKRQDELDTAKQEEFVGKGIRGTKADISFEDLGFDYLTYDELQNANHVFSRAKVEGGSTEFRGMTQMPSVEGIKLWLASQYIQRNNNGRGMIGLSATPFRNSVLEYFSVMSMVARDRMKQMGVFNVNSFMTMFMDITTRPEFKADGQYADKTDVRNFINYQQFSKLLSEFIDFKEDNTERPVRHQREHIIPETATQIEYKEKAQELFADTKNGGVLKGIKEMKMTAISPYLSMYNENRTPTLEEFVENSPKIKLLAKMIAKNLKDNPNGNQIVYSPIGTNVFGYIKDAIVKEAGLDPSEVAIIAGKAANPALDIPMKWNANKSERTKIQEDFNAGKVKVIIGSETIEEGINLQMRSTDLFVLSEPWNFTSLRQVTGRLWRPKNMWRNVRINHMLTENSIDIFLLQKLETKGSRFDATTEFKGDVKDTGEIDPGTLKWDLLTDPVQRTNMKYEEMRATLTKEKKTLESELAYDLRKVNKYMDARKAVFKTKQSMKEHPDWDFLESNLKRQEKYLAEVLAEYKDRNIDLTTIDQKIADAEASIAKIEGRLKNIEEEEKTEKEKAQKEKVEAANNAIKNLDLDRRITELEDDNIDLFSGDEAQFKIAHDRDGNALSWVLSSRKNGQRYGSVSLNDLIAIPYEKIIPDEQDYEYAEKRVKNGMFTRSSMPLLVVKQKDGMYKLKDGHHRLIEQRLNGAELFYAMTDEEKYEQLRQNERKVNSTGDKPMYKIAPGKMYHATRETFTVFDDNKVGTNTGWDNATFGHFFLDNKDRAVKFGEDTRLQGDDREVQIKEVYLDLKNPIDLTYQGIFTIASQAPTIVELTGGEKGMNPEEALELLNEEIGLGEIGDFMEALYADPMNKKIMQDAGYDGIISEFGREGDETILEYVVFSSDQIKTEPVYKIQEQMDALAMRNEAQAWAQENFGKELPAFKESTQEEQVARVEAYQKRFNLPGEVYAVQDILTGRGTAEGVFWNGKIAISEKISATVSDHEFMHKLMANLNNIAALSEFNKREIYKALNGGKEYTVRDIQRLDEKNSLYFEEYVKRNDSNMPTLLKRFYAALQNFLYRLHRDYNPNVDLLRRFYAEVAFGSGNTEAVMQKDGNVIEPQLLQRGKDMLLDFGYAEKKKVVDEMHQASYKEILDFVDQNEEMPQYFKDETRKDINTLEFFTAQSHDLFLKNETEFEQAKVHEKIGTMRVDNKRQLDKRFSTLLTPYFELKGAQRAKVDRVLMQGDRDMVEYSADQLRNLNLNAEEIKAYQEVRKAFNGAHAILLLKMEQLGIDKAEIDTFRNERTGYMPHKWKYKHVVKERRYDEGKEKWITSEIKDFKTERLARRYAEEQGRKNSDAQVEYVVTTLNNVEQDFFIQQGLSFEAMKQVIELSSANSATKEQMIKSVRDLFKSKGFGSHYIKRWGIEGYQDTDMAAVIANYFSGFSGYVTKMEAAPQYYANLSTIDPRTQPNFYKWVRDSITYEMGSHAEWSGVRTAAFTYFLANDLSYLAANATQNYVIGTAELSKELTGVSKVTSPEARIIKATTDWATNNVSAEEREAVEGLLEKGELGGHMASELMGFKNNPLYRTISSGFSRFLYDTTAIVETHVNRVPLFLAARRVFIERGMNAQEANERALEVSDNAHFRYGKQHRPVMMRGRKGVLFIFLHYMRSFLYLMYRDVTRGEYLAFSRTLMWTTALGGTTSLPMAKLFLLLFGMVFKDYEDDEGEEAMKGWELMMKKGIPATMGADMSGRVGVELLAVNMILEKPNEVMSYIGAGGGLAKRLWQGVDLIGQGREVDAAAKLLPDMIANPIKAYQGYTIGVRSNAGVPLEDFDGDLYKYNTLEAIIKATGLTPTRESLLWDAKAKQWDVQDNVSTARGRVRGEIRYLVQSGDFATAREVQAEAIEKGIMKDDMDYVKEFGKDIFIMEAYESLGTTDVRTAEQRLIKQVYPEGASDQQKNNLRKELAVFRVYGTDNKLANDIASAGSNDDKLQLLLDARDTMGADAVADFIRNGRKEITLESGRTSEILISDDLLKRYKEAINP